MKRITKHPLYVTWKQINDKCHRPTDPMHHRFGKLGIQVCDRWRRTKNRDLAQFDNFINDMGPRPEGTKLVRKDPLGDFSPSNCYWGNKGYKQTTKFYDIGGRSQSINGWCVEYNVDPMLVRTRLTRGWDILPALTTEARNYKINKKFH